MAGYAACLAQAITDVLGVPEKLVPSSFRAGRVSFTDICGRHRDILGFFRLRSGGFVEVIGSEDFALGQPAPDTEAPPAVRFWLVPARHFYGAEIVPVEMLAWKNEEGGRAAH